MARNSFDFEYFNFRIIFLRTNLNIFQIRMVFIYLFSFFALNFYLYVMVLGEYW